MFDKQLEQAIKDMYVRRQMQLNQPYNDIAVKSDVENIKHLVDEYILRPLWFMSISIEPADPAGDHRQIQSINQQIARDLHDIEGNV